MTWSGSAIADLVRLRAFLYQHDPEAAVRAVRAIRSGAGFLRANPRAGRRAGPPDFREWPVRFGSAGYVVRYRLAADHIVVLRVRHMREAPFAAI